MLCCLEQNHQSSSKLPGVIFTGAKPPELAAVALSLQLEWSFLEVMVAINSLHRAAWHKGKVCQPLFMGHTDRLGLS